MSGSSRSRADENPMGTVIDDPKPKRLRRALGKLYGDRIERVVLFGSRARGDANKDSDYDIAVFLNDLTDRWRELDRLADIRADFVEDSNVFIDAKPYPSGVYHDRTTLMREIRREGADLRHQKPKSTSTRRGNVWRAPKLSLGLGRAKTPDGAPIWQGSTPRRH